MSATNRGRERRSADYYPTDPRETRKLYQWAKSSGAITCRMPIIDPCAGEGAILQALHDCGHVGERVALELREECRPTLEHLATPREGSPAVVTYYSIRNGLTVDGPSPHAVITNPPFSLAQEFVSTWAIRSYFTAMLLPLSFLGGKKRAEWWRTRKPRHLLILSERPSFVAVCSGCKRTHPKGTRSCDCGGKVRDGTDAMTYAWFVWMRNSIGGTEIGWI